MVKNGQYKSTSNISNKYAIFAFRGEGPCFLHAVLNAEDMRSKGFDVLVVMEGGSVKLISKILSGTFPVSIDRIKDVVDCACLGCSQLFKVTHLFDTAGIRLVGEMNNHISIADYILKGYKIIVM
jgi:hypothetical protein